LRDHAHAMVQMQIIWHCEIFDNTGTRKVKLLQVLIKRETMGWQWHQLDNHCTSLQTALHRLTFIRWMLFLTPKHWRQRWQQSNTH